MREEIESEIRKIAEETCREAVVVSVESFAERERLKVKQNGRVLLEKEVREGISELEERLASLAGDYSIEYDIYEKVMSYLRDLERLNRIKNSSAYLDWEDRERGPTEYVIAKLFFSFQVDGQKVSGVVEICDEEITEDYLLINGWKYLRKTVTFYLSPNVLNEVLSAIVG